MKVPSIRGWTTYLENAIQVLLVALVLSDIGTNYLLINKLGKLQDTQNNMEIKVTRATSDINYIYNATQDQQKQIDSLKDVHPWKQWKQK